MAQTIGGNSLVSEMQMLRFLDRLGYLTDSTDFTTRVAYKIAARWNIRADIVLALVFHETGYMARGQWCLPGRFNLAGLGVTGQTSNNPKSSRPAPVEGTAWVWFESDSKWHQGLTFADLVRGIEAVFAHVYGYFSSTYSAEAAFYDPRYDLLFKVRQGKKPAFWLTDLNDQWAQTRDKDGNIVPNHYGEKLEEIIKAALKV